MSKIGKLCKIIKHAYFYISAFAEVRDYTLIISQVYMEDMFKNNHKIQRAVLWAAAYRNKKDSVYNALHKVGIV